MDLPDDTLCTGCGTCVSICPKQAIKLLENEQGFRVPVVDDKKCIHCNKCVLSCPVLAFSRSNELKDLKMYIYCAQDERRLKSSSGAFFRSLAEKFIVEDGYVCGAAFDENWEVKHIIIHNNKELDRICSSKYVQSKCNQTFPQIKNLLENNKKVLFSGTPCQIAGLCKYLGQNFANLLTVDLFCQGVPASGIWRDYLHQYADINEIKQIDFRDKSKGWEKSYGQGKISVGNKILPIGIFFDAFLQNIIVRKSCENCLFSKLPRVADISIGDFWGYRKYNKKINDDKGISIILGNNKKGNLFINKVKGDAKIYHQITPNKKFLGGGICQREKFPLERERFFKNLKKKNLLDNLEHCCNKKYDVALLSFWNVPNYGSALVAYAVYKIIENMGLDVVMINKKYKLGQPLNRYNSAYSFGLRKFLLTKSYDVVDNDFEINDYADAFVVGSDTLWWWRDVNESKGFWWLDFVKENKKKISFCTSFAQEKTDIPLDYIPYVKKQLSRFDAVSVREKNGQQICSEVFSKSSHVLMDPTLVLDKKFFDNLLNETDEKFQKLSSAYVFAYILDITEEKVNMLKYIAHNLDLSIILVPKMDDRGNSVYGIPKEKDVSIERFLFLIKNADVVITDSFHGICFSIIYNKNFYGIVNKDRGIARYKIFQEMGLEDYLINSLEELMTKNLKSTIDYSKAQKHIFKKKNEAINWLKHALFTKYDIKENKLIDDEIQKNIEKRYKDFIETQQNFYKKNKLKLLMKKFIYQLKLLISKPQNKDKYQVKLLRVKEEIKYLKKFRK